MVLAIRVVEVDVQVHRLVQLPPDGFHGPLSPGDGRLDHEHGLADLPQHPLPGGSIGGWRRRHLHGSSNRDRDWAGTAGPRGRESPVPG